MLTELNAKNAKPRDKRFKLYDGRGLYLLVNPSGSKRWEFRYKFPGAEGKLVHKTLSLGTFEEVGLKAAREKTQAARQLLNDFVDPAAEKAKREIAAQFNAQNTFTCVAKEWFDTMSLLGHLHMARSFGGDWKCTYSRCSVIVQSAKLALWTY